MVTSEQPTCGDQQRDHQWRHACFESFDGLQLAVAVRPLCGDISERGRGQHDAHHRDQHAQQSHAHSGTTR